MPCLVREVSFFLLITLIAVCVARHRYVDDLAFKLLTSHKKVGVTAKIIDEQLAMLLEYAPEWCKKEKMEMVGGRELFQIVKGSEGEKVWKELRPRLKETVDQKRAEARAAPPAAAPMASVRVRPAAPAGK
jgi:hypothetical protein